MNKEKIDEAIQIITNMGTSIFFNEDIQGFVKEISKLTDICKNESIKNKINSVVNEFNKNKEISEDLEQLFNEISADIQYQIPEDLSGYFYAEAYGMGVDDILGLGEEKQEVAKSIWEKRIEERLDGTTDDEKIKMSEDLAPNQVKIKRIMISCLSDSKKIELVRQMQDDDFEKTKIIKTIKDANKKIEALREHLTSDYSKCEVIKTIEDADKKIEALKELTSDDNKASVIKTIEDADKKIEALREHLTSDYSKFEVINTIEDADKKIEALKELNSDNDRAKIIKTIQEPDKRLNAALENIKNDELKVEFIKEIGDPVIRLNVALKNVQSDSYKVEFIKEIGDPVIRLNVALKNVQSDSYKVEFIEEIKEPYIKVKTALKELKDKYLLEKIVGQIEDSEIIDILEKFDGQDKVSIARSINRPETKLQALDLFEGQDWIDIAETLYDEDKLMALDKGNEEQKLYLARKMRKSEIVLQAIDKLEIKNKEVLKRLFQKNNDVVRNIDIRLLDDYYIQTLGEDKINLISCYPDIQEQILMLEGKKYEIFTRCLDNHLQKTESDEWSIMASNLITNLQNGQYSELINNIENIEDIDIDKLSKILQYQNVFQIKTAEDIKNCEELKSQRCDEWISKYGRNTETMKIAVFWKLFGQDTESIKKTIKQYGQDIDSIDEGDAKDYVKAIITIMNLEDEKILEQIYDECEGIGFIDRTEIERKIKTAYGKKYNEGLYQPKEDDVIDVGKLPKEFQELGVKVYDAGTDFRMIITSIAPYCFNIPQDFQKDWNRPVLGSQHFCASYIRNDMLGRPPIPHLCYGFAQMKEDSLMLSGFRDIFSSDSDFVSSSLRPDREVYYTPDRQIDETLGYNEMDFRRYQGGIKKQPDYIVAFKVGGEIHHKEKIIQAVKDWGEEIPIVIVDEDKCLEYEKDRVNDMLKEYEKSKDSELATKIQKKVRNNRMTTRCRTDIPEFCSDIEEELEQISTDLSVKETKQQDVKQNHKKKHNKKN